MPRKACWLGKRAMGDRLKHSTKDGTSRLSLLGEGILARVSRFERTLFLKIRGTSLEF